MQVPKQVSLKATLGLVSASVILVSAILYAVWAVTPTSTYFISPGVYPGAPSYTVWKEGSNYFAKDANGEIDYSGTNFTELMDSTISAATGIIEILPATYSFSETIVVAKNDITLRGQGINTVLLSKTTPGVAIQLGDETSDHYYINIENLRILNPVDFVIGFKVVGNTYYSTLNRVRVGGGGGYNCSGIVFESNATWQGYHTVTNPHLVGVQYGIQFTGNGDKNGIFINGGFIAGNGADLSDCYGIKANSTNSLRCVGLAISATFYGVWMNCSFANQFVQLRLEDHSYGVYLASDAQQNTFLQFSVSSCTDAFIADWGNWNHFRYGYDYWTEQTGVAYFSSNTSTTFNHNLESTPILVLASFNSTATGAWKWTATNSQITITVATSGAYKCTWYAEYSPSGD